MIKFINVTLIMGLLLLSYVNGKAETAKVDTIYAEGRYVMGDRDSRDDARQYALLEAKRLVMEQTGTYLKSQATVENFVLTEQEIETVSVGLLKTEILEERTEPTGETMIVIVKIRAIVNPGEVKNLLNELRQSEANGEELSHLRQDYARLVAQLDSLKAAGAGSNVTEDRIAPGPGLAGKAGKASTRTERPVFAASRTDRWNELERVELLMQIITESGKAKPDVQKLGIMTQHFLTKFPRMTIVHGYLGIARFKNDQIQLAIQSLEQAIQTKAMHRPVRANKLADRAIKNRHQKELARFHYYLALCFKKSGNKGLALRHLREAQKLDPGTKKYNVGLSEK